MRCDGWDFVAFPITLDESFLFWCDNKWIVYYLGTCNISNWSFPKLCMDGLTFPQNFLGTPASPLISAPAPLENAERFIRGMQNGNGKWEKIKATSSRSVQLHWSSSTRSGPSSLNSGHSIGFLPPASVNIQQQLTMPAWPGWTFVIVKARHFGCLRKTQVH